MLERLGRLGLLKLLGSLYVTTQRVLMVIGSQRVLGVIGRPPRRPSLLYKGLYNGKRAAVAVTAATMAS
jgi:hypothetical protein